MLDRSNKRYYEECYSNVRMISTREKADAVNNRAVVKAKPQLFQYKTHSLFDARRTSHGKFVRSYYTEIITLP